MPEAVPTSATAKPEIDGSLADSGPGMKPGQRLRSRVALLLVVLLAVVFVIQMAPHASAPFGASHDGFNGSIWSAGSRALRERGVVASKFGGAFDVELPKGYAHHPPLIYSVFAASESVLGEHPTATRLPIILGSTLSLFAAYFLLREMQIDPLPASLAVCLAFATPMFFVYGGLPDTAMLGLPLAMVLLLLWQRYRSRRGVNPVLIGFAAAASTLASWQGMLTAMVVSACALWSLIRRWEAAAVVVPLATVLSTITVFAWVYWVYGSWDELWQVSEGRSSASLAQSLEAQFEFARSLYPITWALIPFAFAAAMALRATRTVGVTAVAVVVAYGFFFRSGALIHDYWNYWGVLPIGIGLAVLLNWLLRRIPAGAWPVFPMFGLAVVGGGLWLAERAPARSAIIAGEGFGRTIADSASQWPPDQRFAYYEQGQPFSPILTYYTGRPPRIIRTNDACAPSNFFVLDVTGRLRSCGELAR